MRGVFGGICIMDVGVLDEGKFEFAACSAVKGLYYAILAENRSQSIICCGNRTSHTDSPLFRGVYWTDNSFDRDLLSDGLDLDFAEFSS